MVNQCSMKLTMKYSFSFTCIILILLYHTDKTLAAGSSQCKFKCRQTNTLLKLEEGVTYIYNIEGSTETLLPKSKGPYGESVKLNLKAKVEVASLPQCKTLIQLRQVQISGPDGKAYNGLPQLEQHPLVVSLQGGKLDSEVCAVHDDSFASLNIKRAVASLLQVNTNENGGNGHENDVFGSCPTHFKITKDGDVTVVTKHKDLERCQFRENLRQSLFSIPHGHVSDIQASPFLDSSYEVEQRIKNGILESATAKEDYLFRPFANRENGAKTKVITRIVLESKAPGAPPAFPNNEPRPIFFENPHETVSCNIQTLMAALHKVADSADEPVSTTAAKDFGTLVKLMRRTSKEDLLSVYGNCKAGAGFPNRQVAKKIFTDALFQAGSADSVAAAVELLRNNEITGDMAKFWYLSFAFVRHTSASALASATTLLDNPKLPFEAYLGIGALAGHYCREHACEGIPQLDQLLAKFVEVIGTPAKVSRDKENYVIAALKGLKNVKHLNEETANKITHVMKDGHVSSRIRVAALEAAQSDACRGKLQKGASDIFYNREEDSEIRIKAYLVLVECPNAKLANKLSEFLETEPVNQVGAFVTSHLRNLRSSSNPDKDVVREILANVKPRRKFPFDVRKFSQNHEFSYNIEALNTAAAVESNVIFSQKSYLPRSVNLNLTVEVFGQAFNLFELNGRAENLEKVYEKYFGPRGYFQTNKPKEILMDARNLYKDLEHRLNDKYQNIISRARRSVARPDINRFASKVKLYNSKLDYNLDVDLSMKVLGNELSWVNIEDIETPLTPGIIADKLATFIENGIGSAKDFRKDMKNHYHFLDSELTYPTSTGFPLRLTALGSGVVYLKLGGNFDASAFLKDPKNGLVKFEIIPSASVEIAGEMGVDGFVVEAGVKLAGNLHTSTGSEITLKMLNGHGFDLHVGLPVKNSDVVTINTELFSFVREQGLPSVDNALEFNVPRKDIHGCFDQLQSLVGLTFCGDIGFPNDQQSIMSTAAMYPLNGHSKLSFRLDKDDDTLTTYHMKVFFDIQNPKNRRIEMKIDTPGSKFPREVSFLGALVTEPEKAIDIQFISPIHQFVARGAIIDNDAEYSLSGFIRIDDTQEYRAKFGLVNRGGASYAPVLEYSPAEGALSDVKVDGEVFVEKNPGSPRRKFTFRGVRLVTKNSTYTVDGTIATDRNLFQTDLKVAYDVHAIGIKTKFLLNSPKNFIVNAEITPSQFPDFNVGVNYEHRRDDNFVENNLSVAHGKDLSGAGGNKFSLFQSATYTFKNIDDFQISAKNSISYPLLEIQLRGDGELTRKRINYDIEAIYGKHKLKSKLDAKHYIKTLGDYDVQFMIGAFEKELNIEAKRDIVDPSKSRFTQKLEIRPGRTYDVAAEVTHYLNNNEVKVNIIATSTNFPNYALDTGLITTPAIFDGYLKVNDGSKDIVQGLLKFSRVAPISGNVKLFVQDHVDLNGDYNVQDNRIIGAITAKIIDFNAMYKGDADLMKAENKYTGLISVKSEQNGTPKWSLQIQTDTDLTPRSINSRNKVSLLDKNLEVNFNGESMGTEADGTVSGGYQVTLPNGKFFTGSFKEGLRVLPRDANGELFVELGYSDQPGGPVSKIFLNTYAKNVDFKRYSIDGKFDFGKDGPEGNVQFSNILRSVPQDGTVVVDHETSITGSLMKMPYQAKSHVLVSKPEISFAASTSYGTYDLKSNGKILTGIIDKVRHLEYTAEITTPLESARRVQIETLFHFAQGDEARAHMLKAKQYVIFNDKVFKMDGDAEIHLQRGSFKGSLALPGEAQPNNIDVKYNRAVSNDIRKAEVSLNANYDTDKNIALNTVVEYRNDLDLINGQITGQTSLQNFRIINAKFSNKKLSSTARNTDFDVTLNENRIEGFAKIDITPKQPLIDITANSAQGKTRFYYKLIRKGDRQTSAEGQVAWTLNGGGQLDFSTSTDVESYDNFHILVKANSEKLNLNKLKVEIGNKAVKSGAAKKINFAAQTADKKGFSGSVTYAVKELDNGFTVEGKGHIEFQNEKHPLTYKAQFKTLTSAADSETGTSFVLNADFEKGNFVFEHKISDKELYYISKFCKDGRCAHSEVKNKLLIVDYTEINHDASIIYQNSLEGRNDDFKAFSNTQRKGFTVNHESGVRLGDRSYNLKYYVNKAEGGLIVNLPRREIAAVATYNFPTEIPMDILKSGSKNIQVNFDGSLYLDRTNKPQERGNLLVSTELLTSSPRGVSGEIKLSHPALHRDMIVKGRATAGAEQHLVNAAVEIDIFPRKNHKIAASLTVDHFRADGGHNVTGKLELLSKGMNLDIGTSGHLFANENGLSISSFGYYHDNKNVRKEFGGFLEANRKRLFTLLRLPNRELLKVDSVIQGTPEQQVIDTEINLAELRYYTGRIETQGLHAVKASIARKENPNKKLELSASLTPMLVELRVEKMEGPAKEDIFLTVLASNKNPEKQTNFMINSERIKECMKEGKAEAKELVQQVKALITDLSKQSVDEYTGFVKGFKKVQPDVKPLFEHYRAEFNLIRTELAEDPQFKTFSTIFQNVFGGVIEALEAYVNRLITVYEKLSHEAVEMQGKLAEMFKEVLTRVTESYEKLLEPFTQVLYKICDVGCSLAGYALDFLKAHETEIRQLLAGVGGYVQEFAEICTNTLEQIKHEAEDFFKIFVDEVKGTSLYASFQEKFKELTNLELPQALKNFYSEFKFALEDILRTPELREFYENIFAYLIKMPIPSFLVKLPKVGVFRELTIIRYLKTLREMPSLVDYYFTYRPMFNLDDIIPPYRAYGIILNSHHFFTFDQKHYTFKGTCSYVLAQDFLDGNFSIVANIENAKIKSITVSDQKDTVELFSDNTVSVNGVQGDYPVNHNDFNAWVRYGTANLRHKAGVFITKYNKQDMFIFRISGFYFGRTRGLLGTISNEHYDDYTLPNGHIVEDANEFANSYKVLDSCPASTQFPPASGRAPECTKLFSSGSDLEAGFNLINPEIYREACDQHVGYVQGDKLTASCDIAAAYVLALKQGYLPFASVPDECVQCTINGQPMPFGQKTTVQFPQGKADVVIVFEQTAFNNNIFKQLITPLIASLSHDLKEKGLGDVEFALIGYGGPGNEWPQHYGNNGKLTYEGNADKIKFKEVDEKPKDMSSWENKLEYVIKYINLELGRQPIVQAMQEANIYPFRQGASKIILLANSNACPLSPTFPLSLQLPRIAIIRNFYREKGLQFHFITPMSEKTKFSNKPDVELKNVVGFDSQKVYTFADAKKNELEGDATDRPHLVYDNDLCLSFAQNNGGAAFNSKVFANAKPEQQKKFVHVVSKRIAKGAVAHRYTENCSCKVYHGIFYYPECKVIEKV